MKIKSIAAICKKNKNIAIFERYSDDGDILTQYIGDGNAADPAPFPSMVVIYNGERVKE